jgi:ribonuclease D
MHKIKKRHQLAVVKSLWEARDDLAAHLDVSPGRCLSDLAISTLALASESSPLATKKDLEKVLRPIGLRARWFENTPRWIKAIEVALALPEDECPTSRSKSETLPPIKVWREKYPEKFIPLSHARHNMALLAEEMEMPLENLLTPEHLRQVCWRLPDPDDVPGLLADLGARPWQIEAATPILISALAESEALEIAVDEEEEKSSPSS